MRRLSKCYRSLAIAVLAVAAISPALLRAQDAQAPEESGTPERGVARISVINAEVSVRRGDSGDWVAAALNAPLMVEDRVATGAGSRAEVQFDSANLIRLGANAEVRLAQLDYGHYHLQIAHGTVTFRVLRESHAKVELDTPAVSVRPVKLGSYRVYVQDDGQTEITVRLGDVEVYTPQGTEQLRAGQTMLVRGDPSDPEFRIVPAISYDDWDRWNDQRDKDMLRSRSYRNVPQDVYGSEDLDNSGQWVDVPSYGEVWAPEVGPDWAPYQNGRWVWEDYYGWTWVSYDPWGWAPFHYGRWLYAAPYGWCWYPGRFGHHYWSPALVAWFGYGSGLGVGVGFGFGNVGWVALAPFERIYPWWGRGLYAGYRNPAYFNRGVNITNVNIRNVYRNARVANGAISVSAVDFRQGRFNHISRATPAQIHEAGLVRGQLPVAPGSANLRYSNRTMVHTPRGPENVRFFSHTTPAPVRRVPFTEQQRAMQTLSRQPAAVMAPGRNTELRSAPSNAVAPGTGGWRRLNVPPATASPERANGWQRFGEPRPASSTQTERWSVRRPNNSQTGATQNRSYSTSAPRPQSIRVAPPVVRERSTPRTETRSAPRGGDSGGHAPRGGGGGGGSRGGGGGSHGGGGHR